MDREVDPPLVTLMVGAESPLSFAMPLHGAFVELAMTAIGPKATRMRYAGTPEA